MKWSSVADELQKLNDCPRHFSKSCLGRLPKGSDHANQNISLNYEIGKREEKILTFQEVSEKVVWLVDLPMKYSCDDSSVAKMQPKRTVRRGDQYQLKKENQILLPLLQPCPGSSVSKIGSCDELITPMVS